jgi:hypothetical protein
MGLIFTVPEGHKLSISEGFDEKTTNPFTKSYCTDDK